MARHRAQNTLPDIPREQQAETDQILRLLAKNDEVLFEKKLLAEIKRQSAPGQFDAREARRFVEMEWNGGRRRDLWQRADREMDRAFERDRVGCEVGRVEECSEDDEDLDGGEKYGDS